MPRSTPFARTATPLAAPIVPGGVRACITTLAIAVAALLGDTVIAAADEVTSKDTVLHGTITGVAASGITFEPEYGKGSLTIKWEDIQGLKSDGPFEVLYGEDEESDFPLQGFSDGQLLVGATPESATGVDVTTIHSGFPIGPEGASFADRMRSSWRYWDGNFDLGFNLQRATTDTTGFLLGFQTKRTKGPTRFSLGVDYRYSTQKKKEKETIMMDGSLVTITTEKTTTIEDRLFGFVRDEYDFAPRFYAFAAGDATYDGIQRLSIRGVPKAGVGYIFWEEELEETKRNFLQGEVGPSWVYEKYFGGDTNDYFAIAFGLLAGYHLPYGAHFDFKLDYLPAVDDFANDYLLRGEAGLTVPVIDPLSAKFSLVDEYDSTPAEDTDPNSLYLALAISLGW